MGVRYTNQAITTEQQIDLLKGRGLFIDDVEQAIKVLDTISYFRLAGYWRYFEADHTTHQFRDGCRFWLESSQIFEKLVRVSCCTP